MLKRQMPAVYVFLLGISFCVACTQEERVSSSKSLERVSDRASSLEGQTVAIPDPSANSEETGTSKAEQSTESFSIVQDDMGRVLDSQSERDEALSAREAELEHTQEEIEATLVDLRGLRQELQAQLYRMEVEHRVQIDHMSQLLESMEPVQAAEILAEAPIPMALEILMSMNQAKAGEVLGNMDPKIAADLFEKWMAPTVDRD